MDTLPAPKLHRGNMEKKWIKILENRFGSLDAPDYSFVLDEIAKARYKKVVDEICKKCTVQEDTDENYDVSFGYILSFPSGSNYLLRISMIGPFAFLAQLGIDGSVSMPILRGLTHDEAGIEVIEVVESHGIVLLDAEILNAYFPRLNKYAKPLYQWLFVDEGCAPWGCEL